MTNFCPECFHDKSLSSQLKKARPKYSDDQACDFHPTRKGMPAEAIVELVDGAFRANFGWAEQNPHFVVKVGNSLEAVLEDLVRPDNEQVLAALKEALEESEEYDFRSGGEQFYDDSHNFVRHQSSYNPLAEMWDRFKFEIAHRRRFFYVKAQGWLEQIFSELHYQEDENGRSPIYSISPGKTQFEIFRARRIDNHVERAAAINEPQRHLAPPPERLRKAGRLNASGVSCFYGAFETGTCLSELRAPVGSMIVCAKFELIRPITVLDMTRFAAQGNNRSIFSPVAQSRLDQWRFMRLFRKEITQPILPDDEVLDYISTQAVAEFIHYDLAGKLGQKVKQIDGIIYESAQCPEGLNIALFGDAALVEGNENQGDVDQNFSLEDQARMWDDGAGFTKPSIESFLGSMPALRCLKSETKVFRVSGTEVQFEEDEGLQNWDEEL